MAQSHTRDKRKPQGTWEPELCALAVPEGDLCKVQPFNHIQKARSGFVHAM